MVNDFSIRLFSNYSAWFAHLNSKPADFQSDNTHIFYDISGDGPSFSILLAGHYPTKQPEDQNQFTVSLWDKCGVAWSMHRLDVPMGSSHWKSDSQSSTLPYGWIPDGGEHIFELFVRNLREDGT